MNFRPERDFTTAGSRFRLNHSDHIQGPAFERRNEIPWTSHERDGPLKMSLPIFSGALVLASGLAVVATALEASWRASATFALGISLLLRFLGIPTPVIMMSIAGGYAVPLAQSVFRDQPLEIALLAGALGILIVVCFIEVSFMPFAPMSMAAIHRSTSLTSFLTHGLGPPRAVKAQEAAIANVYGVGAWPGQGIWF